MQRRWRRVVRLGLWVYVGGRAPFLAARASGKGSYEDHSYRNGDARAIFCCMAMGTEYATRGWTQITRSSTRDTADEISDERERWPERSVCRPHESAKHRQDVYSQTNYLCVARLWPIQRHTRLGT
ncbi:hypothetical protein M433DRAFT_373313 [Acidomyces richmondensis BFW]|nr:MAG: hypothetical protein FE78DRAFT_198670 [Acidomyces sp. 'richmondensis']KYG48902.1 hypothetical protein M433DRAFT_373313 [Acidomyces richmondensis BFW]